MNDDELRALVREAVQRHLGARASAPSASPLAVSPSGEPAWRHHPSHGQYLTVINVGDQCVIEPGVECNHCGYCKSHGH